MTAQRPRRSTPSGFDRAFPGCWVRSVRSGRRYDSAERSARTIHQKSRAGGRAVAKSWATYERDWRRPIFSATTWLGSVFATGPPCGGSIHAGCLKASHFLIAKALFSLSGQNDPIPAFFLRLASVFSENTNIEHCLDVCGVRRYNLKRALTYGMGLLVSTF